MGVDPLLLTKGTTNFSIKVRIISGFAARVRTGYYGRGCQVIAGTVSSALSMDTGVNPILVTFVTLLCPTRGMVV